MTIERIIIFSQAFFCKFVQKYQERLFNGALIKFATLPLFCFLFYCTVFYCIVLYCILALHPLRSIVLHCIYCIALHRIVSANSFRVF